MSAMWRPRFEFRMPGLTRGWLGAGLAVAGLAIGIYGGRRLGRNVDFWQAYGVGYVESVSELREPVYPEA